MTQKPPFKLGISIGPMRGLREFNTEIENPAFAVNQANQHIHENYDPRLSLLLIDESSQRRKSRKRL